MKAAAHLLMAAIRPPWRTLRLVPAPTVQPLGFGRHRGRDADPQFQIDLPHPLRPGLYEFDLAARLEDGQPLAPKLYPDYGDGFSEREAQSLPRVGKGARGVFFAKGLVRRLRLDPISASGAFVLDEVRMRRIGLARFAARVALSVGPLEAAAKIAGLFLRGPGPALAQLQPETAALDRDAYHRWIKLHETPGGDAERRFAAALSQAPEAPRFDIVMPAYNSNRAWLEAAIESVRRQSYPHWTLCIVDDCSPDRGVAEQVEAAMRQEPRIRFHRRAANGGISAATNDALKLSNAPWVAFLDHDDTLSPDALLLFAAQIQRSPAAKILYSDEDKIDELHVRSEPFFKPDWNRELFYGQNYLNHLTVIRRELIEAVGGCRSELDGSQDYDLVLRCIEQIKDEEIQHLPFVCYHWRFASLRMNFSATQGERTLAASRQALNQHFSRTGAQARSEAAGPDLPFHRVVRPVPEPAPLVSLIIPTRNQVRLLRACVESLRAKAGYEPYEILIVDNDSDDPATLDYMRALEHAGAARIVPAPGPFNYSAINNKAAREARGQILGLINNDVEAISEGWLREMVSVFSRPDVAAVGARLLYSDGRVQHAGVVTGMGGVAGHVYKLAAREDFGPFSALRLAREATCVTAACMLVRRAAFEAVGGLDEHALTVAFNDVDLCLKLRARGGVIVWTPFAELYHHESVSRGSDLAGEKLARALREVAVMRQRWGDALEADPHYNPNLSLVDESAGLAFPPRVKRPWA